LSTTAPTIAAKPLRADAARNRAKVIEAARAAFAEHGTEAQVEDVARRAGVGVGTVYRHFPTKHALAEALIEERFDRTIEHIRELRDNEPDPWRALEGCFEYCAVTQEQDRAWASALALMVGGIGNVGPREDQLRELLGIEEELIVRAREAGVVRDDLTSTDMPALFCALASVVQADRKHWRRYLDLLLDGLRPR